jgi:delta 1-pyrroline-5-carboxylate dehydrogenase
VQGAFGRSGQKCSANSVVLAHEDVWPKLKDELVRQAKALKMTNPVERSADLGPVINERAFDKIAGYVDRAKKDPKATLLAGGTFSKEKGFYIEPTLFEVNDPKHELLVEEIFGPVTAVKTFRTLEEAVSIIEQHSYRLTGAVISRDESWLEKAIPVLSQLAGNFYVNRKTTGAMVDQQPFGGDGASGTNAKAGGKWYLTNFVSQGAITRRHARSTTPSAFDALTSGRARGRILRPPRGAFEPREFGGERCLVVARHWRRAHPRHAVSYRRRFRASRRCCGGGVGGVCARTHSTRPHFCRRHLGARLWSGRSLWFRAWKAFLCTS